jgi:hypothetical protein
MDKEYRIDLKLEVVAAKPDYGHSQATDYDHSQATN